MLFLCPPIAAQAKPQLNIEPPKAQALMTRIQNAGTEVVEAKAGTGSATLSMAWAAARFADACLRAMAGEGGVVECAFVVSTLTSLPFFASPVSLFMESLAAQGYDAVSKTTPYIICYLPGIACCGGGWAVAVSGSCCKSCSSNTHVVVHEYARYITFACTRGHTHDHE